MRSWMVALTLAACTAVPGLAAAAENCVALCEVECLKPLSFADRWDDQTPIAGYPSWQNNHVWNGETFSDQNGNKLWDAGEPFVDANGNGKYDSEFYDPVGTGFTLSGDEGLELKLVPPGASLGSMVRHYYALDLPLESGGPVPDSYRWNFANCNPTEVAAGSAIYTKSGTITGATSAALRELYDKDPGASYDSACNCVVGSAYDQSPRHLLLGIHDPRKPLSPGDQRVHLTKVGAAFLVSLRGDGSFVVRLARTRRAVGAACASGSDPDQGFAFHCEAPVPTRAATWGRVKALHR